MKHEFTDEQIAEAFPDYLISWELGEGYTMSFGAHHPLTVLHTFLNQLPEPTSESDRIALRLKGLNITNEVLKLQGLFGDSEKVLEWLKVLVTLAAEGVELDELRNLMKDEEDDRIIAWQECEYDDYKRGDQVKIENNHSITYVKSRVKGRKPEGVVLEDGEFLHKYVDPKLRFYRIPAPVTHPDPKKHEFIRDERDDEIMRATPHGSYVDERGNQWPPTDFTNWTPLKVVEEDD